MVSLSDNRLEELEHSRAYLVVDFILNWTGGVEILFLLAYSIHWWSLYSDGLGFVFDSRFGFWKKVLLFGIVLILVKDAKDHLLAWMGVAPPDEKWIDEKLFGKQIDMAGIDPAMDLILYTQYRATRIRKRGIRVEQLLAENEAIFVRKQGKQNRELPVRTPGWPSELE